MSGRKYSKTALASIRVVRPRVSTRMASGHGLDEPSFSSSLCKTTFANQTSKAKRKSITSKRVLLRGTGRYRTCAEVLRARKLRIKLCARGTEERSSRSTCITEEHNNNNGSVQLNSSGEIPYVRRISWNVIFRSGVEILLRAIHGRSDSLVAQSKVPPGLVHLIEWDLAAEHLPAPLTQSVGGH